MAKKLNKVFLNPTPEQIEEYQLVEGKSWFEEMDALAAAIEEDQKKKAAERVYSLKNFQIIDGAHDITANLSKIVKQTGFTLSNDLSKVLDWAKTEIDYDVDHVTDHRVAATKAEGEAELSEAKREAGSIEIPRNAFAPTAAGQQNYEDVVDATKEAFDDDGSPVDTKVIGYKDVTLTNVGSKATAVEEGEAFDEKKTVVTNYSTVDVKGGDFSFDYKLDSVKTVDKKDPFLVTEAGKETAKASAAAAGTLTVKDSVIGSVTASFSENAAEIKALHKNKEAKALVNDLNDAAGSYEDVVIDNSTVQGDVKGGKISIDSTRTFKNETFLDKPEESGDYFNAVSAEDALGLVSNNKQLYVAADGTSALTETEAKALKDEGYTVNAAFVPEVYNTEVNKYEIVSYDLENNEIRSGKFVYLSNDEFENLSGASRKALGYGAVELNVGWIDYTTDRVVTDANFETFTTAPAGAAASSNVVKKFVFGDNGEPQKTVTYYLTDEEAGGTVGDDIKVTYPNVLETSGAIYRRVADAVTVENYKADAKDAYSTVSTTYSNYTISKSMDEGEALELNKEAIPAGFAWVKTGASSDGKALFRMSKFTKSGDASVETKYYLTAEEMSAMKFFGDGVSKTFDEVRALAYTDLKLDGWAFTDNAAAGDDRLFTDGDKQMYREGAAATTETLANYTTDKTAVVTADVPYAYRRYELAYTTDADELLLGDVTNPTQFNELVKNNLVGENSKYVTVIDGETVNMYQIYGYGKWVNAPEVTVTTDKLTENDSEINYEAVIQEALWEGDDKVVDGTATLVDGVKTQNTKKFFDPYASLAGKYVEATKEEEAAGEKTHEFITVAEERRRSNNAEALGGNFIVTDVQAKIEDGGKYVAAYIDRAGALTTKTQDETANATVFYYRDAADPKKIYALTEAEATAAVALLEGGVATKLKFFTAANKSGWYANADAAKTGMAVDSVTEVTQPQYRDHNVAGITAVDISAADYTVLKQGALLTDAKNWTYDKAYVTEEYLAVAQDDPVKPVSDDWGNRDRVQIAGKDAFIEAVSGTLVTDATTTYDAIYAWKLNATQGGASVDDLTYYMTEAEKAQAVIGAGYVATAVFEKTGDAPIIVGGNYQYRVSNAGQAKEAYLTYNTVNNAQAAINHGAKWVVDNSEAYYKIDYVHGHQVYKYTLAGDTATYYLTEAEADFIGGGWGGALTKGDAVEGVVHYGMGMAGDYAVEKKANFTKADTVYYLSDSYAGWSITVDGEGKAVQAFDADGAIWSNIDAIAWTVDDTQIRHSNYASELCENTYNYNYDGDEAWTTAQIELIKEAEEAAGIATWKLEDKDGQIVWTRTSAIGEVSTYAMEHENVAIENNGKENKTTEATGSISVINGSDVKGDINGYLNVLVTDSKVQDVTGGKEVKKSAETLSTSKGKVAKDGTRTITTKETEKSETTTIGTGSFEISRTESDKIYEDADDVTGYETVTVTGVNTGNLTVDNTKSTSETTTQTTYQGDEDALRSDYRKNYADLAFTKGVVSKVNAETKKSKGVHASIGSAEITGREYKFTPGTEMDTANTVGDISGYKTVVLTNANAGDISADDSTSETQDTYKLATKGFVDTATETSKSKTDVKAVAELIATNSVTNPDYEADLTIGDIDGYKTVTAENYSFGDANAQGNVTRSSSSSSVREAVASDMRLVNAGVDPYTGDVDPENGEQKYTYGGTTSAVDGVTYAKDDMSSSSDSTTKRTAVGTLTATGRAYTKVTANYTEDEDQDKKPVFAYTQTATNRTVYLTEEQFDAIQSGSKADAAQWTKDEKTVVYYRNSDDAVVYNGDVTGTQVVYECKNAGETVDVFLTEGELANYNRVNSGDKLTKSPEASLRSNSANKVVFGSSTMPVNSGSGNVGTLAGVWHYVKAGEADQFLTEAEAAELGADWKKDTVDTKEYVRKGNAGDDDRTATSVIDKSTMDGDLKVYQNNYDSSRYFVLNADEEAFLKDTSTILDDFTLTNTKGYRLTAVNAGLTANVTAVATAAELATAITEAHNYVLLNNFGEVMDNVYVTDAEYDILKATGKALEGYVLDDGTHDFATTQFQYRKAGFKVTADTTIGEIVSNVTVIPKNELYGLKLTDEQIAAAKLYDDNEKSAYALEAVTEDPIKGNTHFGNIYGYKTVELTGMEGGNIIRVQDGGAVAADNETSKSTYKKTVAKGTGKNKGKTTYTENDSSKSSETWSADGSVTLTDSKVADIAGYKKVEVKTVDGTVEVGQISRTTQWTSFDKSTNDVTNKVVTEDAVSSFKVTHTRQTKSNDTATAAGSVSLVGQRAGEALVLDDSVVYKSEAEAVKAAQDAIDAHDNKQIADVVLTGGVVGYQNVNAENVTITADFVTFDGGKWTRTSTENHTTVEITDNHVDTVKVTNKINDSDTSSDTATGSLTLTNVNYADPNGYVAGSNPVASEDYTTVNEYVFNGVTYALTVAEKNALLEYADVKQKGSTEWYVGVLRKNDTVTTPAVELTGTLQDVVNAKGVDADTYGQDKVYFAAKAKDGTGTMVDLYVAAEQANELLAGKIEDAENLGKYFTEATVNTSKEYYGGANDYYKKAAYEAGVQVKADVKKYVVTADEKATTYYLTDAEANVMKAAGMDVKAGSDTTAYTRMTSVGKAVTVNAAAIAAAEGSAVEVYEYRGVEKDTGKSASYYLKETEVATCLAGDNFANFGKVGTTKYLRNTADVDAETFKTAAVEGNLRTEVLKYSKAASDDIYLTEAEFGQLIAVDPTYDGYAKAGDTKYYRVAKTAYDIADPEDLDAKFTSVNESAEVFKVTNNQTAEVLGYLTLAELLALKDTDFNEYYTVAYGTTYLRAADDTTNIIKFNGFEGGYEVAPGADLEAELFNAAATENAPVEYKADAWGFKTVTLTNADMRDLRGGDHTSKTTEKLAAKKNSTIATYTKVVDTKDTSTGSLTATDSAIGDASGYDKVILTAEEMDKANNKAGNIGGGKVTENTKSVYTTKLYKNEADYSTPAKVIEYTRTTKTTANASGSADLLNVVAGNIRSYKSVTVAFDEAIDEDDKTKNEVGSIEGGNAVTNETETYANVNNDGSYSETVTKMTITSVGTVDLTNVYANGEVSGFQTANVTDSEIDDDLTGGNYVSTTTKVDVNGVDASTVTEITVTAVGKAAVANSKVGGNIAQFKDVELTGGVEVGGNIIVGGDDNDEVVRAAHENTACFAVFFTDSDTSNKQVVYLTSDEYEVFATKETSAMIDTTVAVYRDGTLYPALTDAELKDVDTAVAAMKGFTAYTDDAITDGGFGQEGKNATVWTVKTAGNTLKIDEDGAKVGGKVEGYASVIVSGDSSFGAGYFGTAKNDKLTVEAGLATFTTVEPGKNPVGFDFGEGKDELILNGTIGIQAAFKYDEVTETNAWNLEKVSGTGTIVCRTADVEDVKEAFDGINVVGTDNYNVETALEYQSLEGAMNVLGGAKIDEWLGFCDAADYFKNSTGEERTFSFSGASVTSGDVIAQMTVDGGASYTTLKDGDTIASGAVVRISQLDGGKNKTSNDYQIAFKA